MSAERFKVPFAVYLILVRDNKVLLLKRKNTGWRDGEYTLVAGHVDGDEAIIDAMVREAKEEAGIAIEPQNLKVVVVGHQKIDSEYLDFFLTADKWSGEATNAEPEKCEEIKWFDLSNLPENIVPTIKLGLENFQKGVSFYELGFT